MVTFGADQTPEIDYPCHWNYKLVGRDKFEMKKLVARTLGNREFSVKESKKSRTGKFVSLNVDVLVFNDDERRFFYDRFRTAEEVLHIL